MQNASLGLMWAAVTLLSYTSTRSTDRISFAEFQRVVKKDTALHYVLHSHLNRIR